ncbi:thiopeptide-type bacteriocin biosynthesis protein [Streptomyces ipomoeae]|uniref:thiopeptide-type bacteriocin biosynthesis protein n=1 Tax=Streptomyces ipomoeae TaxID=103232 RepID=UPI0029A03D13|nr:thiopeptide-type bacteriocin biosynthesis protein [Streptomyces ipomoeae]MDX2820613.1 thiopeptide-type bacteriocin biosynthesis protein [Streptomyces ipomoeae]MDX2873092.1 thiopeptide-type bacteriocin biosynthesis protein [Streptomyces ipomoeae]
MPTDRLNQPARPEVTLHAVLEVLAGTDTGTAAARAGLEPSDLDAAVTVYQQAGQQALGQQAGPPAWRQLYVQFTDWDKAEQTAADHLAPVLDLAQQDEVITGWWFIRKHPCWRMRLLPASGTPLSPAFAAALDDLTAAGRVHRWWPGIYEPETAAFGGDTSMAIAHSLFHADSHAILTTPQSELGRRELSLLLCATLMRAAGLEWYEQGDAWHRIAQERPLPTDVPAANVTRMAGSLRQLLVADTSPIGPMLQSDRTLKPAADWVRAFRHAGRELGTAAREGILDRGLREVISYHVIFHWNRLGLPARTQSVLAHAARAAILQPVDSAERATP